jgi:hypothetical protein
MLSSVDQYLIADISEQRIGPIFKDYLNVEDGTDSLSWNVHKPMPCNIPEERRSTWNL